MKNILVIEDSRFFLRTLTMCLEDEGYSVVGALTGEDGIRAAQQCRPDLILLDMFLPRLDGMMVLRMLNGDSRTRGIPVLVLSGNTKRDDITRAKKLGVIGYHVKDSMPVEQLMATVKEVAAQSVLARTGACLQ